MEMSEEFRVSDVFPGKQPPVLFSRTLGEPQHCSAAHKCVDIFRDILWYDPCYLSKLCHGADVFLSAYNLLTIQRISRRL